MKKSAVLLAILAALFYALSTPIAKLLLVKLPETMLAGLLYLGAGLGMMLIYGGKRIIFRKEKEEPLTKLDLPYIIGMVVLDIIAPIMLLLAIKLSSPSSVSLLNNFEIVATSLIALLIFKEKIDKKLWIGIILVTIACILLSINFKERIEFSMGSLFAIIACLAWGLENNCTRKLSSKNPFAIVIIKGLGSGMGSLLIALLIKEWVFDIEYIIYTLVLGFIAYGLSVFTYVLAQRYLGAAKTSAYYAVAPFIGVVLAFIIFKEVPNPLFIVAILIMIIGVIFVNYQTKQQKEK